MDARFQGLLRGLGVAWRGLVEDDAAAAPAFGEGFVGHFDAAGEGVADHDGGVGDVEDGDEVVGEERELDDGHDGNDGT